MALPFRMIETFRDDETGAITVDWVAVTAGILMLGVAVVYSIFDGGVSGLTSSMNEALTDALAMDASDPGASDGSAGRTGNASDKACMKTAKFVVCMGPMGG